MGLRFLDLSIAVHQTLSWINILAVVVIVTVIVIAVGCPVGWGRQWRCNCTDKWAKWAGKVRTCGHAGQLWLSIDQTYLKSLSAVVLSHALANISILIFVYFHNSFIFSPFRTIFSAFHTIEVTSSSPHGTVK